MLGVTRRQNSQQGKSDPSHKSDSSQEALTSKNHQACESGSQEKQRVNSASSIVEKREVALHRFGIEIEEVQTLLRGKG